MKKDFSFSFRKNYPLQFLFFNIATVVLYLFVTVWFSVSIIEQNTARKLENLDSYAIELVNGFYNFENVSVVLSRNEWLSTLKDYSSEEIAEVQPYELLQRKKDVEYYNAILGTYSSVEIYLAKSNYFLSYEGFKSANEFNDEYGLIDWTENILNGTNTDIRTSGNSGNFFYVKQSSLVQSVYFVFITDNNIFKDMAQGMLTSGEGLEVSLSDSPIFTIGKQEGKSFSQALRGSGFVISYYYEGSIKELLLTCVFILSVSAFLYILLYFIISKMLYNFNNQVKKLSLAANLSINKKSASTLTLIQNARPVCKCKKEVWQRYAGSGCNGQDGVKTG